MRIYLAGENGKKKIIPVIAGGAEYLCRYLRIENISCGGGVRKSETSLEKNGTSGDYP